MIKIKFNGLNNLKDKRLTIKNMEKARENANFLLINVLNKKKKKELIMAFIIITIRILNGGVRKTKKIIKPKIKSKNISFFPYFSLASIINFNYNRKLWLK